MKKRFKYKKYNQRIKTFIKVINVTSVFYIFNKANFSLISHFFYITRLSLACFNRDICIYINVFFYIHNFFSFNYLIQYTYIIYLYIDFNIIIKLSYSLYLYQLTNFKKYANKDFIKI